jgi:hypothetical protein
LLIIGEINVKIKSSANTIIIKTALFFFRKFCHTLFQ